MITKASLKLDIARLLKGHKVNCEPYSTIVENSICQTSYETGRKSTIVINKNNEYFRYNHVKETLLSMVVFKNFISFDFIHIDKSNKESWQPIVKVKEIYEIYKEKILTDIINYINKNG